MEYACYTEKDNLLLETNFYNFEKHYQKYLSNKPLGKLG